MLELAATWKLLVPVPVAMEDTRTQSATVQVADVDLGQLPGLLRENAGPRIQLLNWRPRGEILEKLAGTPSVFLDTARVESTDGIETLLNNFPAERVAFGTHAPFLIPEASLIRVHESQLPEPRLRAVLEENANRILKG